MQAHRPIPNGRLSTIGPIGFGSVLQPVWQLAQTRPGVIPPGGLSASFLFCCPSGNSRRPALASFPRVAYRLRLRSAARLAPRADPAGRHSPAWLIGFVPVLLPVWRGAGLAQARASFRRGAYPDGAGPAWLRGRRKVRPGSGTGVFPARGLSGWRGACLAQGKARGSWHTPLF